MPDQPRSPRTLTWVSTSYFGEGLPWSFLHQIAMQFLTATGASKSQISSTSLLHLAVTFKFLWSPVVDLFGRKRTWVVVMQLVLGAGMLAVAGVAATRNMTVFWAMLGVLSVLHATHDIACDGFYLQALDKRRQALYSGVRSAAFRAAMLVGSSVLVALAGRTSWQLGFGAAGVLMIAVAGVNAALLPRPADGPALDPSREDLPSKSAAFWAAYRTFLGQPHAVLVLSFMFFYKLGDIMMFAMSAPLLKDIGIDTFHRGILSGIGVWSFIVASLVGAAIIGQRGLERCLIPMTFLQNLVIPLYIGVAVFQPGFGAIIPVIIVEQFASGIGSAAHVVFLMRRSRVAFSASHYAFASAVVSLGSTLSGFLSGPLNEAVGHPWFFTLAFVASWPSLILVLFVPRAPLDDAAPAGQVRAD